MFVNSKKSPDFSEQTCPWIMWNVHRSSHLNRLSDILNKLSLIRRSGYDGVITPFSGFVAHRYAGSLGLPSFFIQGIHAGISYPKRGLTKELKMCTNSSVGRTMKARLVKCMMFAALEWRFKVFRGQKL
uniref:Uncharacterized protein n=1 Tax=Schistocephalus solidus TaxID=70667 RepID=A0A0V0JA98_SCHSO